VDGADSLLVIEAGCAPPTFERPEALRRAVLARELARMGRPAAGGFILWPALIEGRWTLVDAFTDSGTRYVIAHKNRAAPGTTRALSRREQLVLSQVLAGSSSKRIALEMEISTSTVSRSLRAALRRLGATHLSTLAGIRTALFEPLDSPDASAVAFARIEELNLPLGQLTDAERAILGGIIAGQTTAAIARDRGTSRHTVAHQIQSIYRKVGVSSRRELLVRF